MNILPLLNTKSENTKPYKDWLKSSGINNVVTEDYTMRIWEGWLFKSNRFGKNTSESVLYKNFPKQYYLKQLDISIDDQRSSDINLQILGYEKRYIYKNVLPITVSEHSVRRWWEHKHSKPDILSWIEQGLKSTLTADTTELYHPQALLLGYVFRSDNERILLNIDNKTMIRIPGIGFRINTVIPVDMLNENQQYRWYKLKEAAE